MSGDPKQVRSTVKGSFTRTQTYLASLNVAESATKIQQRLKLLDENWSRYLSAQDAIDSSCTTQAEKDAEELVRQEFEDRYMQLRADLHDALAIRTAPPPPTVQPSSSSTSTAAPQPPPVNEVKLPKTELPVFSGDVNEWLNFYDLFMVAVHHNSRVPSKAVKLQYLKMSLRGEPLALLRNVNIQEANYDDAWNILLTRYHKDKRLIRSQIARLVNQKPLSQESCAGLRSLHDVSQECIRALRILNVPVDQWDHILIYHVSEKLDSVTRRQWEIDTASQDNVPVKDLLTFLATRADALEDTQVSRPRAPQPQVSRPPRPTHSNHVSVTKPCIGCNQPYHPLFKCHSFGGMSVNDRRSFLKKHNLCFNCFSPSHQASDCKSKFTCRVCSDKHHSMIHLDRTTTTSASAAVNTRKSVHNLLATAVIQVRGANGRLIAVRALLDSGSHVNLVTEDCVRRLGLKRKPGQESIKTAGGSLVSSASIVSCDISSRIDQSFKRNIEALVLKSVTGLLPPSPVPIEDWSHLSHLPLADSSFHKPGPVDMLLGIGVLSDAILPEIINGPKGTPRIHATAFGYTPMGEYSVQTPVCTTVTIAPAASTASAVSEDLSQLVSRFWEIEEIPTSTLETPEHSLCKEHYFKNFQRDSSGRFVVKLPFNDSVQLLGDSRVSALRRFYSLERRLSANSKLKADYSKFIHEFLSLGHMEPVPSTQLSSRPVFYLPHHCVVKEDSSTTKLRVVFDGSAVTSTGVSLNEALLNGPTIQDDLSSIIIRFRTHPIAFTADVEKMYRMVIVHPDDRDFQRILWRDDANSPVQEFRLCTVTYGLTSAPYLAIQSLQQLAKEESTNFPRASSIVLSDMYVDDLISGCENVSQGAALAKDLQSMLSSAGFNLRKWSSNSPDLLATLSPELLEKEPSLLFEDNAAVKTLGIRWTPSQDSFSFISACKTSSSVTKRSVLSAVSKVFDPIGWLAPITIQAKILLQQLWLQKLGWDEPLPSDLVEMWDKYCDDLNNIHVISIPRCIVVSNAVLFQLHGFCDASEKAYACCVYLRTQSTDGTVSSHLVSAKTKVAPLKALTIPRLELCAAVLLCKLISSVKTALKLPIDEIYAWSDSKVTLAWISAPAYKWKTFVAHRVSEIQSCILPTHWNYVKTKENPADLPSRGVDVSTLASSDMWLKGPSWLTTGSIPFSSSVDQIPECLLEQRTSHNAFTVVTTSSLFTKFSSFSKLLRVFGYVVRFVNALRKVKCNTEHLTVTELKQSELYLCKLVQREMFSCEIAELMKSNPIPLSSPLRQLHPFIHSDGLIRVGGRLSNSDLPFDRKHPIVLPKKHAFVTLMLRHYHVVNLHCGAQSLISSVTASYWILGIRDSARFLVKKCVTCFKIKATASAQLMGNLPKTRTQPCRPFTNTGVDFAGPFMLKDRKGRGCKLSKGYLCLFVCFSTHAVHLEVASDLSSETFIAALRRFVSTRGKPHSIYSDCGTNFKGADKDLRKMVQSRALNQTMASNLASDGINWVFNPPSSPHMGGLWESGVKSVKHHLRRVVGDSNLTYEEFLTILKQIEAILNSRPLTPMSSDPDDLEPLTPGHLLIGAPLTSLPDQDHSSTRSSCLTRWQFMQQMTQSFWKRWTAEHLTRLQARPKWWKKKSINTGDLVLIKEPQDVLHWELGRVVTSYPGSDGVIRVCDVKTSRGIMKRPVNKLCLLPLDCDQD